MELLTKETVVAPAYLSVNLKSYCTYLNLSAIADLGIQAGDHLSFLKEGGRFYIAKGCPVTGYRVIGGHSTGVKVYATSHIRRMMRVLKPGADSWRFYVQDTGREWEGRKLFELTPFLTP